MKVTTRGKVNVEREEGGEDPCTGKMPSVTEAGRRSPRGLG